MWRLCRWPSASLFIRRAIDGSIVFTHGFEIEGQLIFHWICEQALDIDVVTLDTGRLFPETYTLWAETERHYGRRIRAIYPNGAVLERLVARQGIDGIYESKQARLACCEVRKSKPLDRALAGAAAWISGLRADQNSNRRDAGLVGFNGSRGLLKFNPLYDWTRDATTFRSMPCMPRASFRSAARPARARSVRAKPSVAGAGGGSRMAPRSAAASAEKRRRLNSKLHRAGTS